MSNTVISIENVSKSYQLGTIGTNTFRGDVQRWWARMRGLPDPNLKLGEVDYGNRQGETIWALKDINLSVQHGEALGIIGRNGAGKSTLLKILSRVSSPTTGAVKLKGRMASLLEVGTGFHPELTGRENIYLNGAIMGMSRIEVNRKFDEIVDFFGVEQFIDTPVKRYSSGMYVRLAFAVAAHLEPEILIVDEVLAVGDAAFQKKCLGKMGDVAKSGRTILFVSHNMSAIKQLCATSIFLNTGRIEMQGPSADVVNFYLSKIKSGQASSQQEFPTDPNKPAQLRRVSILDIKGNPANVVDLNEEFIIQVEYEFKESLAGISIGCQIIADENNQTLISLSDPELDITRMDKREVGYYQSKIVIPAKILNTGPYQVRLGISRQFQIFDVVDNISFSVVDNKGIVQNLGYERKNALLSMQLPWQVVRLNDKRERLFE